MKKKMPETEYLPVLDNSFRVIGKAERSEFHNNPERKLLHPVVHLQFMNPASEIFLQLRPKHKIIQPGKWDTAVGGHVAFNESIETALIRESREEIGITPSSLTPVHQYLWETEAEKELVYVFFMKSELIPSIGVEEVEEGKFWKTEEISDEKNKHLFTPNFLYEYNLLKKLNLIT